MVVYYCETCGSKVSEEEITSGIAYKEQHAVYCKTCASTRERQAPKIKKAALIHNRPSRPVEKKIEQKPPMLTYAVIGGGIVLFVALAYVVIQALGGSPAAPPPVHAVAPPPVIPTPPVPQVAVTPPVQNNPEPATTKEVATQAIDKEFEERRNSRAAKLLEDARKLVAKMPDYPAIVAEMTKLDSSIERRTPEMERDEAEFERDYFEAFKTWSVLEPTAFTSLNGKLVKAPAHSVLFQGPVPKNDTYTITAESTLKNICAIRLEALPDLSMVRSGPGCANGSFALSNFIVTAAPKSDPTRKETIKLTAAYADFSEEKSPVEQAIDTNPWSAWMIEPYYGREHSAVFSCNPVGFDGGTILTFTLDFKVREYGSIGRVRLSAAAGMTSKAILRTSTMIGQYAIFEKPSTALKDDERETLRAYYWHYLDPEIRQAHGKLGSLYYSLQPVREYFHALQTVATSYSSTPSGATAAKLLQDAKKIGDAASSTPNSLKTAFDPFSRFKPVVPVLAGEPIDKSNRLQPGLWGSYWSGVDGMDPFKTFIFARVESKFCYEWGEGSPDPRVPVDFFGIKWAGKFRIEEAGTYTFNGSADDFMELWIDDVKIFQAGNVPGLDRADAVLSKGDHDIHIRYYEHQRNASVRLQWRCEGRFDWRELPPDLLFHNPLLFEEYQQ